MSRPHLLARQVATTVSALMLGVMLWSAPASAARIVVFGDSWGVPAAPALQQVLIDEGHAETIANAAVGGELGISPATVARHVTNALNKTGLSNRTELAAYAGTHRLLR